MSDQTLPSVAPGRHGDLVAAARALQPLVREHAGAAQQARHVAEPVVRAMAAAGLYGMCAPASLGGGEVDPVTSITAIEAISEADGSTGWVLMIGVEAVGLGLARLPVESARALVDAHPDLVLCGAQNPQGRARRVEGGWLVSGQWPFASGCHNAHAFHGQCVVVPGDGDGRAGADGPIAGDGLRRPTSGARFLDVLVPRADYEVVDTWHVSGLRGTGSHDVAVHDLFVPEAMASEVSAERAAPLHDGPLFRLPPFTRLAYNKVGVATGIARSALDQFVALAEGKVPRLASSSLRERPRAQRAIAEAEAALRGARAFVFEAVGEVWDLVRAGGRADRRQRAMVRLACSHACQEAIRAVELVCSAAGTSANWADSPLATARRDVAVVAQQIMVAPHFIDDAGRVLLGLDPSEPIL